MHFSRALTSLALIVGSLAQSQHVANELSFGHTARISDNQLTVPNYAIRGEPNAPQILSNKVILTPPSPGNQRTALWAEKPLTSGKWDATLDFRATGPERGSGRLQLWLVKDGPEVVGTSSIYTVGKFEGLAIVIDTYGGTGGMIRGYLNDGTKDYGNHIAVDGLAFGHSPYSYRNLGRPSTIHVQQDWHNFRVEVDGRLCFETGNIRIPAGYHFGISAASAETPDSFEVFKLVVTTDSAEKGSSYSMGGDGDSNPNSNDASQQQQDANANANANANRGRDQSLPGRSGSKNTGYLSPNRIPENKDIPFVPAAEVEQTKQFADLHYRLQGLMKHLGAFQTDFQTYQLEAASRHAALAAQYAQADAHHGGRQFPYEQLNAMDRRLEVVERALRDLQRDAGDQNRGVLAQIEALRTTLVAGHGSILEGVQGSVASVVGGVPKLGGIVVLVLGSQAGVVGAYLWYKRRKAMGPKKYL